MQFISPIILHSILAIVGLLGFLICLFIWVQKKRSRKISCPLRGSCDRVLSSDASKIFGVPLEQFGTLYYGLVFVFHILYFFSPLGESPLFVYIHFFVSIFATLFSLYLLAVQAFVLRTWCTWCILSAMLSISITAMLVFGFQHTFLFITIAHIWISSSISMLALALGLSASVVREYTLYTHLYGHSLSEQDGETATFLSHIIILSLLAVVTTTIFSVLTDTSYVLILSRLGILVFLVVISFFIKHTILPNFQKHQKNSSKKKYKTVLVLGISVLCWIVLFISGFFFK